MSTSAAFHKLWIIESLVEGELKTGRRLVENQLSVARHKHPSLQVAYKTPQTRDELRSVLETIHDETKNDGLWPMIHFECHGCSDGLAAANRELLSWEDMRQLFIELNCACRLHLAVVLAACNGIHFIKVATKLDRAPFWAAIGPEGEVSAGAIERDVGAFYAEFFEALDGDAAVAALNRGLTGRARPYHFFTAEGLFAKAYARYHERFCSGRGRRERIEELVTRARQQPAVRARGVRWARKQVKQQLSDEEESFEKMKRRFFFIDVYPESASRFKLTYKDALRKARNNTMRHYP